MSDSTRYRAFRLRASGEEGVLVGVVSTIDDPYAIGASVDEVITRGTFDLDKQIPLFWEHDWKAGPIGHSRALRVEGNEIVGEFEVYTDDVRGRSVWRAAKAGALQEFSVGFLPAQGGVQRSRTADRTVETITRADLLETSVVVRGANPSTRTVETRAVVPPAAMPAPVDPTTGMPMEQAPEEDKPTRAALIAKVAELVDMANELTMTDQLPTIVRQMIANLAAPAPAPAAVPPAPGAPAAPPAPPAARTEDLSTALLRALARDI